MEGGCCASSYPLSRVRAHSGVLPVVEVFLGGRSVRALIDTGCSTALVKTCLVDHYEGESCMTAFDGRNVMCRGRCQVDVVVAGVSLKINAVAIDCIVYDIDLVLGMEVISELGGVSVNGDNIQFGIGICSTSVGDCSQAEKREDDNTAIQIDDKDFIANFNGEKWTVQWRWKDDVEPKLTNKISCYNKGLTEESKEKFDAEVEGWIEEGILVSWDQEVECGMLPLMAVEQPAKWKVRPVLDYRELNNYIECHTGDNLADICSETLREWRQVEGGTSLVDLKSAYLQIHVAKHLWKYQIVKYKGKTYCLTRLGFGLNCAPRIMTKILKTVLSISDHVEKATNSYLDDILVDVSLLPPQEVIEHLRRYGLAAKPPQPVIGGSALGLRVEANEQGEVLFSRGNDIPTIPQRLTRRELFSVCGKLVGHYPVAGWLRVACSFIKRVAAGICWEDWVGESATKMIQEVVDRVKKEDPVKGSWAVPKMGDAIVWCDASSIALGVLLEINGQKVEDAAWLRKKNDFNHINVAELEAILKGLNLALKWGIKSVRLMTDSATVHGWVNSTLTKEKKVKTKGAAEMMVKRRLGVLEELIAEFDLDVIITYVQTSKNKADSLTRVKRVWLSSHGKVTGNETEVLESVCAGAIDLDKIHGMHHVGVDRTLFLARKIDPEVTREAVQDIVRRCEKCQTIDPAPIKHDQGELYVKENWKRLAIDITHYEHALYLSVVDCGPGRFAVWREIKNESADCVVGLLNEIYLERGPPEELLMDNAPAFRSEKMDSFLKRWNVQPCFRAAYRPSGNGIVERHHRTIKAIAERGRISPLEAVFWYNMSPRTGQLEDSVPQCAVYRYTWRHPAAVPLAKEAEVTSTIKRGEEVWVKPPGAGCTSQWQKGTVTEVNSKNNVSVNGVPRHVLGIRKVVEPVGQLARGSEDKRVKVVNNLEEPAPRRYPVRERQSPTWMTDYERGDGFE